MKKRPGSGTLLMSVLMSSPGPIVVGIGLILGRSSTQLADFLRRSAELIAIIVSYFVFILTGADNADPDKKAKYERRSNIVVGAMMCISGAAMLIVALFSSITDKGNVIPGLAIAVLGVVANTLFWVKYTRLNRQAPNSILSVQSRLYRAKALVDCCITVALTCVMLFPASVIAYYLDIAGSIVVAVYMVSCGVKTLREYAITI